MSWVAGIDFSTHAVDVVLVDADGNHPPEWMRTELEGDDAFDRTRRIDNGILLEAWWGEVLAIGIEDPRGHNAGALYRVQGAILANLPQQTLVVPWIPSAWRKAVGLKGNATKDQVVAFVADYVAGVCVARDYDEAWGTVADLITGTCSPAVKWPQDACDAYCIALATRDAITIEAAA